MAEANSLKNQAPEIITVPFDTDEVSCDGGGGPLGHPLVYYTFDGRSSVDCGYCDRCFVKGDADAVPFSHNSVPSGA